MLPNEDSLMVRVILLGWGGRSLDGNGGRCLDDDQVGFFPCDPPDAYRSLFRTSSVVVEKLVILVAKETSVPTALDSASQR